MINNGDNLILSVNCLEVCATDAITLFSREMYIYATIAILVMDGSSEIFVNRVSGVLYPNTVVLLSSSHLFRLGSPTSDFRCRYLSVSEQFMRDMDATEMIYKRIKYGARLYASPLLRLAATDAAIVDARLQAVTRAVETPRHTYYKELVLNELNGFYLDLSDIIDRSDPESAEVSTRYGSVVRSFVELLGKNYRTQHKVDFYAAELNISTHYLTLITKRVTGRTASELIYEMLYSHARMLLYSSRLSIQEIAWTLHFADQSAFGKFFKRRSGLTPHDYRALHHKS